MGFFPVLHCNFNASAVHTNVAPRQLGLWNRPNRVTYFSFPSVRIWWYLFSLDGPFIILHTCTHEKQNLALCVWFNPNHWAHLLDHKKKKSNYDPVSRVIILFKCSCNLHRLVTRSGWQPGRTSQGPVRKSTFSDSDLDWIKAESSCNLISLLISMM